VGAGDLVSATRFAFYGRLSTTDKQDPALSFPSQLKACERKVAELGGEITVNFEDQESGAKQDRPGWSALTHEARDRDTRRFDAVVIYSTSRLARDRLVAALYERDLSRVGVSIHYATGAGDPSTPEGSMFIGMQQLWDEYEREKLARETKRGMREATEQGFRTGGRAPYGYRRELHALPIWRGGCQVGSVHGSFLAGVVREVGDVVAAGGAVRRLRVLATFGQPESKMTLRVIVRSGPEPGRGGV
jgi:DNA invertase Pin-like site-specific DNA recombinase